METVYTLRAHHGLCLAFFNGVGYSDGFVKNMAEIKSVLDNNPLVRITNQVDEICRNCPNNVNGKCLSEPKVFEYDKQVLQRCGLKPGIIMPYFEFRQLIHCHILSLEKREEICQDCEWTALCTIQKITEKKSENNRRISNEIKSVCTV